MEGGENILLDLYPIVQELRKAHPHHFDTLTKVPAQFQKIAYEEGSVSMACGMHFLLSMFEHPVLWCCVGQCLPILSIIDHIDIAG